MEKTMKKILMALTIAALLLLAASGQQTASQEQVNWLDAPTPDGSPTLRETSDYLAKTMQEYGGYSVFGIDNSCTLRWEEPYGDTFLKYTVPMGAVQSIVATTSTSDRTYPAIQLTTGNIAAIEQQQGPLIAKHHSKEHRVNEVKALTIVFFTIDQQPIAHLGENAPRTGWEMNPHIISAMQHAVGLCQSAYKAPVNAKEPF
jgi:hypothetical protein